MDAKTLLSEVPLFGHLSADQLDELVPLFEERVYEDGTVILEQGHKQVFAGVVVSGVVERLRNGVKCDSLASGHTFGLYHLLTHPMAYATAKAVGKTTVLVICAERFGELVQSRPSFATAMLAGTFMLVRSQANALRAIHTHADEKIRVIFYDASAWTRSAFSAEKCKAFNPAIEPVFVQERLTLDTTVFASGHDVISCFVNDDVSGEVLHKLSCIGTKMIAMRCAGFDRVAVDNARAYGVTVARVPGYAPEGVAEHAAALMMSAVRNVHTASARTRALGFSLQGLAGFNIRGKTVGVIGVGRIGQCMVRILDGFGTKIIAYDPFPIPDHIKAMPSVTVASSLDEIWPVCDIITLHVPLTKELNHLINKDTISRMKEGVVIVNVSRGPLIDTAALLDGLTSGKVRAAGLDVFEGEESFVFGDAAAVRVPDPMRSLLALPNVVVTGHQAFLTEEALAAIRTTTLQNIMDFMAGKTGSDHPNSVYGPASE